ncbi:MAG: HPr kinase/phosphorylase, partial [candidate division WOR-3 bacterium]
RCNIHGTLVDIFGIGVLFIGKAGIGKSELALDLVERGHRLVADDLVLVTKRDNLLIGTGCEKSNKLKHHIEIRGVGIVDVFRIFGAKAVRNQKRIEVVVELVLWDETKDIYERVGIVDNYKEILGISIPHIQIPLVPGKNVSTIIEVIAINQLLKLRGINPAKEYDEELKRVMKRKVVEEVRLDEDLE